VRKSRLFLIIGYCASLLGQQVGPAAIGSGYVLPAPFSAAPGQLVTVVVQGLASSLTQTVHAPANADLPNKLAGLTATYWQGAPRPAPMLEVHPFTTRRGPYPWAQGSKLVAITIQIPFEVNSYPSLGPELGGYAAPILGISEEGSGGLEIDFEAFADQVHILTSCDSFMTGANSAPFNPTGLPCPSIVAHADGSLITVKKPASPGEVVVAYAVGLGQTNPALATGKLVTSAAPTQTTFGLDFNFRPNALPTKPLPSAPPPLFAGATPGYVGLYQVNFVIPPVPAGTPTCVEPPVFPLRQSQNVVQSNLTVSVGGVYSFDGARICVAVPTKE
jgi:hypothetical protein